MCRRPPGCPPAVGLTFPSRLPRCSLQGDNINSLVKASGNTIQGFWGGLFAKVLAGQDLDNIIMKPGVGGAPAAAAGGAAPAAGAAAKKEEKKEESSEESDVGGAGGGLFGGGDDDW